MICIPRVVLFLLDHLHQQTSLCSWTVLITCRCFECRRLWPQDVKPTFGARVLHHCLKFEKSGPRPGKRCAVGGPTWKAVWMNEFDVEWRNETSFLLRCFGGSLPKVLWQLQFSWLRVPIGEVLANWLDLVIFFVNYLGEPNDRHNIQFSVYIN